MGKGEVGPGFLLQSQAPREGPGSCDAPRGDSSSQWEAQGEGHQGPGHLCGRLDSLAGQEWPLQGQDQVERLFVVALGGVGGVILSSEVADPDRQTTQDVQEDETQDRDEVLERNRSL